MRQYQNDITVISLGLKEFINKFNEEEIEKVEQKFLQKILKLMLRLPRIKKWMLKFISLTNSYYPLKIIAAKTENVCKEETVLQVKTK